MGGSTATRCSLHPDPPARHVHLVIDAMNVIGARPDGWWRDRPGARRALVRSLTGLTARYDLVTAVFDGRASPGEVEDAAAGGVTAVFAPGGPDAADAAIVGLVARAAELGREDMVVVTSDAKLSHDVRRLGAAVQGAGSFRRNLDGAGSD